MNPTIEEVRRLQERQERLEQAEGLLRRLVQLNQEIGGANPDWAREAGKIATEAQSFLTPEVSEGDQRQIRR